MGQTIWEIIWKQAGFSWEKGTINNQARGTGLQRGVKHEGLMKRQKKKEGGTTTI